MSFILIENELLSNGFSVCFGVDRNGKPKFNVTLPITYKSVLIPFVTNIEWTANAAYSECARKVDLSHIEIHHWYNSGTGLVFDICYMVIGY